MACGISETVGTGLYARAVWFYRPSFSTFDLRVISVSLSFILLAVESCLL